MVGLRCFVSHAAHHFFECLPIPLGSLLAASKARRRGSARSQALGLVISFQLLVCLLVVGAGLVAELNAQPSRAVERLLGSTHVSAIAVGPDGAIYLTGHTTARALPNTAGAFQGRYSGGVCGESSFSGNRIPCTDAFVAKLDASGTELIYATYLGGKSSDNGNDLAVDEAGNAYVVGDTASSDFPVTADALQPTLAGHAADPSKRPSDMFVAIVNPTGSSLLYATYLGGSQFDSAGRVEIDSQRDVYVLGRTRSADFPVTAGAWLRTAPPPAENPTLTQVFSGMDPTNARAVSKIDLSAGELAYSTFVDRQAADFTIVADGSVALVGPGKFPSEEVLFFFAGLSKGFVLGIGAQGPPPEPTDLFVAILNADGSALDLDLTYGGSGFERALAVAADAEGGLWVTGFSDSIDFPSFNGHSVPGATQGFVLKLDRDGQLVFASPLGGEGRHVAVNEAGEAAIVGRTTGASLPTTADAYYSGPCGRGMGARFGPTGGQLYSSYLPRFELSAAVRHVGDELRVWNVTGGVLNQVSTLAAPPALACIINSASKQPALNSFVGALFGLPGGGSFSPGAVVDLYGFGLGPVEGLAMELNENGRVSTQLGGIRVFFDETPAPLLSVQDRVIRTVIPFDTQELHVSVRVEAPDQQTPILEIPVLFVSAGVFTLDGTGEGPAAVLNEDGTVNSPNNPARKGSVISIFGSGGGQTQPPSVDGAITPIQGPLPELQFPVRVTFDQAPREDDPQSVTFQLAEAEVVYAGPAPGLVAGVIQVNAKIPLEARSGPAVGFTLGIGFTSSPHGPTIAIQ